jgi:uncharacterized protein YbjQ (UPF0145 family)
MELIVFLTLLTSGYIIGTKREKLHIQSLQRREERSKELPVLSTRKLSKDYQHVQLFMGSVVIGQDYFKHFVTSIVNLVGGRVTSYETLLDRARREATLRMKEKALRWGAQEVTCIRIETSKMAQAAEVLVYATAGKN